MWQCTLEMSRSDVLLQSIEDFYDDTKHFELLKGAKFLVKQETSRGRNLFHKLLAPLAGILEKKTGVSLRNLEWYVHASVS